MYTCAIDCMPMHGITRIKPLGQGDFGIQSTTIAVYLSVLSLYFSANSIALSFHCQWDCSNAINVIKLNALNSWTMPIRPITLLPFKLLSQIILTVCVVMPTCWFHIPTLILILTHIYTHTRAYAVQRIPSYDVFWHLFTRKLPPTSLSLPRNANICSSLHVYWLAYISLVFFAL